MMRRMCWVLAFWGSMGLIAPAPAQEPRPAGGAATSLSLSTYVPPPESQGGWRSLLPERGEPSAEQKSKIRELAGVDWDKLKSAWEHNAAAPGATGLLVIRKGYVVGEWYKDCTSTTAFNIYSSSKSYMSTAFGLVLADFGHGKLPDGRTLTLDTKVCNADWIPESHPLSDPRKAEITVRNLLNMASGIGPEAMPKEKPFETALGHVEGSPFAALKGDPGTVFNYSNAGDAHLVLLFNHAMGVDLFPFVKPRLLDPIGMEKVEWDTIGGSGSIGPYNQGFSGIHTNPREHARFCYLALHRGEWAGRRIVPASYFEFAWSGTKVKSDYGAQWWVSPRIPGAPADLAMTLGRDNNDGFVLPSQDLVFVRLGDGSKYPKAFKEDLVTRVLAAIEK
jgi:CubicO group peptidase (beta-lactamase class C family)